jgi:outer membrane receptor protein involved in Fe transport
VLKTSIREWLRASVSIVLALGALPLIATAADTPMGREDQLEEIIVTAQLRTENLQDVPISAQVIGSQKLAEQNYNTLQDLTRTIPGVHISTTASVDVLSIRGISSGTNPSLDESVAMFVDDIYRGRSRNSQGTFLDLDRIEVLKGPQSTFFGNNAIAGALNIVTKKPGDTFDASARLLYGQFGQYTAEGAVTLPLTDFLGVRLAVTRNGVAEGWVDKVNTGETLPRINNVAGRVTVLFHPTENLDATLKLEGSGQRLAGSSEDTPAQFVNCPPPAPLSPAYGGTCAQALALNVPIGLDTDKTAGLPGQGSILTTGEGVLTVNYRKWNQTFTSVTGFNNYHYNANQDNGQITTPYQAFQLPESYHQFSQELRVASATGGPIEYMVGAYFQTDELNWKLDANFPFLTPIIGIVPPFAALIPYTPYAATDAFTQNEHVYSVFGSLTWNVSDALRFSAGLRASRDSKSSSNTVVFGTGTALYGGFVPLPTLALQQLAGSIIAYTPGTSPTLERTDQALMPSANIQFKINSQTMAYASYNKGFKAGGFDGQNIQHPNQNPTYQPEHVNAYELGLKSKWFDDRLLLNVDVFRSDYRDLQVEGKVYVPAANEYQLEIGNAAISRAQGVEFEGQWAVSKALRMSANISYLDSYYVSYPNATPQTLQSFCSGPGGQAGGPSGGYVLPYCGVFPTPVPVTANLAGHPTLFAPKWSGSVAASYTAYIPGGYRLTTEISPYFTSSYNNDDPYLIGTDAYVRLDARVSLETPDQHLAFDVLGKNLTDKAIVSGEPGLYFVNKEMPRNVAAQIRYRW